MESNFLDEREKGEGAGAESARWETKGTSVDVMKQASWEDVAQKEKRSLNIQEIPVCKSEMCNKGIKVKMGEGGHVKSIDSSICNF